MFPLKLPVHSIIWLFAFFVTNCCIFAIFFVKIWQCQDFENAGSLTPFLIHPPPQHQVDPGAPHSAFQQELLLNGAPTPSFRPRTAFGGPTP